MCKIFLGDASCLPLQFSCGRSGIWVHRGCCSEVFHTCQSDTEIPHSCSRDVRVPYWIARVHSLQRPCKRHLVWTNTYAHWETPNHSQQTENVTICSSMQAGFREQRDGSPWATENKRRYGVYDTIGVAWKERRNLVCNARIPIIFFVKRTKREQSHCG